MIISVLCRIKKHVGKKRKFLQAFSPLPTVFSKVASCRKFSKRVENSVGKGEIACYKKFILFPKCFQRICIADT